MTLDIEQGDVWEIDFGDDAGIRPGVVVSRDQLNLGDQVLVVPCTGKRVVERTIHPQQRISRGDPRRPRS